MRIIHYHFLVILLASCATYSTSYQDHLQAGRLGRYLNNWPTVRFVHLTDIHVFPQEWAQGATYQKYIEDDPKLLKESQEIFLTALEKVRSLKPDFLILSGDLTKDGEIASHEWLAQKLGELKDLGIPSYVIPGNHDLNNPDAVRYFDDRTERVPTASPEDFARIYAGHGYDKSLDRDAASLSYLVEPVPGLWLLALDSCVYENNFRDKVPYTGGRIRPQTLKWMENILLRAQGEGKAVIAMLHHPPNEQWKNRERYMKDFVLEHHREITRVLTAYGVPLVFSGHTHSQDITLIRHEKGFPLYSVVTGSTVSYNNAFRLISLDAEAARIESFFITDIPSFTREGRSFAQISRDFSYSGVDIIARKTLNRFGIGKEEADRIAPRVAEAFLAFWAGDEKFSGTEKVPTQNLSFMGGIVVGQSREMVENLWEDLEPVDNRLKILKDGSWQTF